MEEVYDIVEKAIDHSFDGKFLLKFYEYLKERKTKRVEVVEFIHSSTAQEITSLIGELEEYLEGGSDYSHKFIREAYGHIPKPQARKIKDYLNKIIDDAKRYDHDRKPGRRKKQSK